MNDTLVIRIPAAKMNKVEIDAHNMKCAPDGRPYESGLRTNIKGPDGVVEEFWLTFRSERNSLPVAMIGMLHQCCMQRWGPGQLDIDESGGSFVWILGSTGLFG